MGTSMIRTRTHTRTHTEVEFSNPFLICDQCGERVSSWHDPQQCGCDQEGWHNLPCEHRAGVTSECYSWGPVDGCLCQEILGRTPHPGATP